MYIKKDLLNRYALKWYGKTYDELTDEQKEFIRTYIEESLL